MAFEILEFGLPKAFLDENVPAEIVAFCSETDGLPFPEAVRLAQERGYKPLLGRVRSQGANVWFFGLLCEEQRIPLMVKVRLADEPMAFEFATPTARMH